MNVICVIYIHIIPPPRSLLSRRCLPEVAKGNAFDVFREEIIWYVPAEYISSLSGKDERFGVLVAATV